MEPNSTVQLIGTFALVNAAREDRVAVFKQEGTMLRQSIAAALAMSALVMIAPIASAQQYGNGYNRPDAQNGYNRPDDRNGLDQGRFWQGAPESPRERIDWLQQRIQRGVTDGSLDRREAYQSQRELNSIRRMAMDARARDGGELVGADRDMLQRRLDDLSQRIRWRRQNGGYAYSDRGVPAQPGYRDPYATEYDAAHDYRDAPQYQERRLASDDQVYRGSDGRYYCKRSDGTTGLIIGAAGGGVLGNIIDGGHNRVAGTLLGGALGALAGKTIDQNSDVRCR